MQLGDFEEKIISANYKQFYSRGLACGFYLTSRLDKLWWKYKHSKSFKVALLDLGHASQTFLLTATALGLQTWITAAFEEKRINDILQLENIKESPFLFLGAGYGTGQTIPDEMQLT
jgi:SagB-type dehydrogenase family enzyme